MRDGGGEGIWWTGEVICSDVLRTMDEEEEELEPSTAGRRKGRGGACNTVKGETGDCERGPFVTTGDLEDIERGGIGGGVPLPSPSLGTRLRALDGLVLDLPNDD